MGMFDSIRCDYPLPGPSHQRLDFQTKSLFCMLLHYTITVDGRLLEDAHRDGRHVPVREWPFHGDLIMGGGDPGRDWVDYFIRFTHGRVEQVRRLEEPLSGEEALRRDEELDERLLWPDVGGVGPALEGRRLTESEFTAQAPASLELREGSIVGGAELLRLAVTNLGLRRAMLIVGRRAWEAALGQGDGGTGAP